MKSGGRTLLKGGRLIDPTDGIDDFIDLSVSGQIVEARETRLPDIGYDKVIDCTGRIIVPGLIDLHTHVAEHITPYLSISADRHCLPEGTTTSVDAGSTGALTFEAFNNFVIGPSRTRILAFLNAESLGMIEFPPRHSRESWPELLTAEDESFMQNFVNREKSLELARKHQDLIVGIKWAHHGMRMLEYAVKLAREASLPIMAENHFMPYPLSLLMKGDIVTHIFHSDFNSVSGRIDGILDEDGSIHGEVFEARKKGILLDLGHGGASFSWEVAEKAAREGLYPDIVSTDLWQNNLNGPVYSLPLTMSKILLLGMDLNDVVRAATTTPASVISRSSDLGGLAPGSAADVTVLQEKGYPTVLVDSSGAGRKSNTILSATAVLRAGELFSSQ